MLTAYFRDFFEELGLMWGVLNGNIPENLGKGPNFGGEKVVE